MTDDGWTTDRQNPVRENIVARVNDTCCDDRGHEDEPFRVFVWLMPRRGDGYWSHVCSFPTQREAEDHARAMASGFPHPLPTEARATDVV